MNDTELMNAMRATLVEEEARAPQQHRLRTPSCPSLTRFPVAVRQGWKPQEEVHVATCPYCQKIIAMEQAIAEEATANQEAAAVLSLEQARNRRRWIGTVAGLAAALLLGVFLGGALFHKGVEGGQPTNPTSTAPLLASAELIPLRARGATDEVLQMIEVSSNFDGFATVVVLIPDHRQQIVPELGEPIRVKPDAKGHSAPLSPVAARGTVALVIVTETPAEGVIRQALDKRTFLPDQIAELEAYLKTVLEENNYRRHILTRTELKPVNPKER